jgi:hypothetical protein
MFSAIIILNAASSWSSFITALIFYLYNFILVYVHICMLTTKHKHSLYKSLLFYKWATVNWRHKKQVVSLHVLQKMNHFLSHDLKFSWDSQTPDEEERQQYVNVKAARRGSTTVNIPPTNLTVCGHYKTGLTLPAAAGRKTRDRRVVC